MRRKKPKLTQVVVNNYVEACTTEAKVKAVRQRLRSRIIAAVEYGCKMPNRGPFVIVLTYQHRPDIDWEDEFLKLARLLDGSKAKAAARLRRLKRKAPRQKVPKLDIKPNPDWKGE